MKKHIPTNISVLFFLLVSLIIIVGIAFSRIFKIDDLIYSTISNNSTSSKEISEYLSFKDKWEWVSYFLVPLFVLVKTCLIATVLYIGVFFFSKNMVSFKQLWTMVVKAEFIFLFVPILKICWFYFFKTTYNLNDIQYFFPLSALNIVGYEGLESWFVYPFQTINVFELAYSLLLSYYIGNATQTNMDNGLKIVAFSYGPALLLWVVTIMFFTLNYS